MNFNWCCISDILEKGQFAFYLPDICEGFSVLPSLHFQFGARSRSSILLVTVISVYSMGESKILAVQDILH